MSLVAGSSARVKSFLPLQLEPVPRQLELLPLQLEPVPRQLELLPRQLEPVQRSLSASTARSLSEPVPLSRSQSLYRSNPRARQASSTESRELVSSLLKRFSEEVG